MNKQQKPLKLLCIRGASRGSQWTLCLDTDEVRLFDQDGEIVTTIPRTEAMSKFTLPSFWESVSHLEVQISASESQKFYHDRAAIARIRDYFDQTLLRSGQRTVTSYRWKGWLFLGLTPLLFAAGIGDLALVKSSYRPEKDGNFRRVARPALVLITLGFVSGYQGIKARRTYSRLVRLAKEK